MTSRRSPSPESLFLCGGRGALGSTRGSLKDLGIPSTVLREGDVARSVQKTALQTLNELINPIVQPSREFLDGARG